MEFIGAGYNRCSCIYKIIQFKNWVFVVLEGGGWAIAERGLFKIENVQAKGRKGPNFGHFVRT